MTPRQLQLARHALGLDHSSTSYRNRFMAPEGREDRAEWLAMCEAGYANDLCDGSFCVTFAGWTAMEEKR